MSVRKVGWQRQLALRRPFWRQFLCKKRLSHQLCEAFVTSVVGAYGIVYCVDHWVEGHVSPSDVLAITDLDNATFACAPACEGLLATFAGCRGALDVGRLAPIIVCRTPGGSPPVGSAGIDVPGY